MRASPGIRTDPSSRVDLFTREFFSPGMRASSGYTYSFDIFCLKHEYWAGRSSSISTLLYSIWFLKLWRHVIKFSAISESQQNCVPFPFSRIFLAEVLTVAVNSAILYQNVGTRIRACSYRNFPTSLGIRDLGHTKRDHG